MAVSALFAAASGMRALDEKLNVVANNLANINTVGFKRSRANFEDLLYQVRREPGALNFQDEPLPHGLLIGLGTRVACRAGASRSCSAHRAYSTVPTN